MFSTLDYFTKRLTFQSMNSLNPSDLGWVYYPALHTPSLPNKLCSSILLYRFQFIFLKYELLEDETIDNLIEKWRQEIGVWKQMGMSSIFFDNMVNFMNKKSIVIDDSVFLISTTTSEMEKSLIQGEESKSSSICGQEPRPLEKGRKC